MLSDHLKHLEDVCVCMQEREGEKYNRNVNYYRLKTNTF